MANGVRGKYSGVITRERITKDHIERSAIDLVCLSEDLVECLELVKIDEDKTHCLESIQRTKKGIKISKSDHNSIISKFNIKWNRKVKKPKVEMYNLKNKEAQVKFTNMTSKEGILSNIIDTEKDVTKVTKTNHRRLKGCVRQCFDKVRISEHNGNSDIIQLFDERRVLRTKTDKDSEKRLIKVEEELADRCAEDNMKKIEAELQDIECEEGGFNMGKLWKLKKSLFPYNKEPLTAMIDAKGNLITSETNLKEHTINHYKSVLSNRPINDNLIHLKDEKEELFRRRVDLAKINKSELWNMEDLEVV